MNFTPIFASSPDSLPLIAILIGPFFVLGLAIIGLIVNRKWAKGRWWGFIIGAFAAVGGGLELALLHACQQDFSYVFWASIAAVIISFCSLFVWGRPPRLEHQSENTVK